MLEKVLENITETIFEDEKYDELFKDIVIYLNEETLDSIFEQLTELSAFSQSKDYTREKIIFKYLCIEENESYIEEFVENTIIKNYKSYPSYKSYFNYVYVIVDAAKEYISNSKLEEYLKTIISYYDYYPETAIIAFKLLKNKIPDSVMKLLVPKLNEKLTSTSYEDTFNIFSNNRKFFSKENENLTEYMEFLVDNITLSNNPNAVINALNEHFSRISKIYELYSNTKNIEGVDYDKAFKFIAKSLDNSTLEEFTENINKLLSDEESVKDCLMIEKKMKKHKLNDVMIQDDDNINVIEDKILLKNILELCSIKQDSLEPKIVLGFIEKALQNVDDSDYIASIDQILNKFDRLYFSEIKRNLNEILYDCYHITTSQIVKVIVIRRVKYFKLTRIFKNKMEDEEKEFYNNNVS